MTSLLQPPPATDQAPGADQPASSDPKAAVRDLLIDIVIPTGAYFVSHDALGMSLFASLVVSSILPLLRVGVGLIRRTEHLDRLAMLMLAVNVASLALSIGSGSARILLVKDSGVSCLIGVAVLASVVRGRPLMSAGLEPFLVKGNAARLGALRHLRATSVAFRRREAAYSTVWGIVLLAECVARIVGALSLPTATMAWMGTVILVAAIATASILGGLVGANPMMAAIDAEVA